MLAKHRRRAAVTAFVSVTATAAVAALFSAAPLLAQPQGPPFEEITEAVGLDFVHFNGMTGEAYFPEIMGSGGALLDYDGDGDLDVYLAQGRFLHPNAKPADALIPARYPTPLSGRLYRNDLSDGRLRFTDVTAASGLARLATGYGVGAATGDVDGDGDMDLYLTQYGPNKLLLNRGDGTFEDATAKAGVGDPGWTTAATFVDFDGDGDLDLLSVNYVEYSLATHKVCQTKMAARTYCSPSIFEPAADRLYRNRGDGTFEDATAAVGLGTARGPGLGAVAADLTGDGRPDLYVANDGVANFLWANRGGRGFADEALLAGAAVSRDGRAQASMGVVVADPDGDGDLDLFMTHLDRETNTFYRNEGGGLFTDRTAETGLAMPSQPFTGFGTAWFDYDNDGDLDLLVVNGRVSLDDSQRRAGAVHPYAERNQLFERVASGYREVTGGGPAFNRAEVSRGALVGDLDNDGDPDVVVTNNAGPVRLLHNRVGQSRKWVGLRVVDAAGADALGATVELTRPGGALHGRVHTDGGYAGAGDPRVLFGLGDGAAPTGARVTWPDGVVESFSAPREGRYTTLRRGAGTKAPRPAGDGR